MKYILITNSNNKVLIFREGDYEHLNKFLNTENKHITEDNYFTEEEWKKFDLYRHSANCSKSDEDFEEYCKMAKRVGLPKPERDSTIRPLHEYGKNAYRDENGKWRMKINKQII